mmetsp:Transcript_9359/g.26267  ORF Transcript_9359/g.26267 Transcript_9359/m.26267 type:complete len:722 (-) Transcript_9359:1721-3886(-)
MPNGPLTKDDVRVLRALMTTVVAPLSDAEAEALCEEVRGRPGVSMAEVKRFAKLGFDDLPGALEMIVEELESSTSEAEFADFQRLMWLLRTSPGSLLLTGTPTPFADLDAKQRVVIFRGWATSMFETKRVLHATFKAIAMKLFYRVLVDGKAGPASPTWGAVGYPGPDPEQRGPRFTAPEAQERMYDFRRDTLSLDDVTANGGRSFDAIIVGSGCGGGVTADYLSGLGYSVLVIEKGDFVHASELELLEESAGNLYEKKGLLTSVDRSLFLLAGSCLGGGSTVNWSCSLDTPHYVREEWANVFGLKEMCSPKFAESLDYIRKRVNVTEGDAVVHNNQNQILMNGCKKLGYPYKVAGQNVIGPHRCGWCTQGCPYAEKQGTLVTFLKDAAARGARFMTSTKVIRVLHRRDRAIGVEVEDAEGRRAAIYSKVVVSSCGAMQTPLLLRRSGLHHPSIGQNLRVHPVVIVTGIFDRRIHPWEGPIMTTVSTVADRSSDRCAPHYGAKLETPSVHPSMFGISQPWKSPYQTKRSFLDYPFSSSVIVLSRDYGSGSVEEDALGFPSVTYKLHEHDKKALQDGFKAACKVLIAEGAKELSFGSLGAERLVLPDDEEKKMGALDKWIQMLESDGWWQQGKFGMFSAHQMGTAKLSTSYFSGPVSQKGETWEVKNLFVADTSLFPTPSGVNPMITCFTICHMVAQHIGARLQEMEGENPDSSKLTFCSKM